MGTRGVKVTEEKVLGALGKRQRFTDVEVTRRLGLSSWKKVEVRKELNRLAKSGKVRAMTRETMGATGRPPVEFWKA